MDGVTGIRQKLDPEQIFVGLALERNEEQKCSQESNQLDKIVVHIMHDFQS